MIINSSS